MIHPHTTLDHLGEVLGVSLVATRPIPRGTVTWARDALDQLLPAASVAALPPLFADLRIRFAWRDAGGDYLLPWDDTRFMNHSCEPNCAVTRFGFEIAVRDIAAGQPLTNDYAMLHLEEDERIACACGASACRGMVSHADRARLAPQWDALINAALAGFEAVPQPLAPLLSNAQVGDARAHYGAAGGRPAP
jgi:hypothetical protein